VGLTHSSLISIGKSCDSGCTATFTAERVVITNNKQQQLLIGSREHHTGLWRLPLQTTAPTKAPTQQCHNAHQTKTLSTLINYLHAAAFSPVPSTWKAAIKKGFFISWPGLTVDAVNKYLTPSEATKKGHLDQTRKNARSTKQPTTPLLPDQPTSNPCIPDTLESNPHTPQSNPEQEPNNACTNTMFATIESTGKIYTDQTGRFPVTSSRGKKYILVLYDYDTNSILTEALSSRTGPEILRGYRKLFLHLQQ
jgi:hypothetical protein